jgi:UDP-glucose 4-epimerase
MGAVLVTGGAGYIGSHIVRRLSEQDRKVLVLDDLSEGHAAALGDVELVEADFGDPKLLDELFASGIFDAVVHMAASCLVGESVENPAGYYENNLTRSLRLLDAARRHHIGKFVFSSSAAVYGEPREVPIPEDHPVRPTNPYGETKLAFERALRWYHGAYDTRHVCLRYFNAAGAHPDGDIGEDHHPESHLLPNLIRGAMNDGPPTPIFGDDYPTSDGTCVRDYVHVVDLAEAHVLALGALDRGAVEAEAFNLGNGEGFSVIEVVSAVEQVTGRRPPTEPAPRRAGDPAMLVASSERARARLGWRPRYPTLEEIVETAWRWHESHPQGYGDRSR